MKIGDYSIDVTSLRINGGWQSRAVLPDGKEIISGPKSSQHEAEEDIKHQAHARLYTQRKYDVNQQSESMSTLDETHKWMKGAINPEHKGYCTPMTKKTCTPRRKAFARRAKKHEFSAESIQQEADKLLEPVQERKLSYQARKHLPASDFVFPKGRRYPIEDKSHARNALARVSQHGSSSEKAKVRAAVHSKYPDIGEAEAVRRIADQLLEADEFVPAGMKCSRCGKPFDAKDWKYDQKLLACRSDMPGGNVDYSDGHTSIFGVPLSSSGEFPALCLDCHNRPSQSAAPGRVPPKAAFYPSDGGGGGGGGGITSV